MKTIYSWPQKPEVPIFLENILNNTTKYLTSQKITYSSSSEIAQELVNYLEEYLYTAYAYHYNFSKIFLSLSTLERLEISNTEIPVQTYNPKIVLSNNLLSAPKEILRYNLYLGLTKHVINLKSEETLAFSRIFSNSLGEHRCSTNILVNHGWILLEDTLVADMARKFIYYTIGQNFERTVNEEYYYEITSMFGLTLSNVGHPDAHSEEIIMHDLLKKTLNADLPKAVISEYYQNNNQIELYQILYIMGLLINEKDRRFPHISLTETENKLLNQELKNIIFSIATLNEEEYPLIDNILPQELNAFEKTRILKLIVEKNN